MLKKSNHDFKEKYPYVSAGTIEPMNIKDKTSLQKLFFNLNYASVLEYEKQATK